jgi:hypothetical protein
MSRAEEVAGELERVWRGDAQGEAFHGRALRPVLEGLPTAAADARLGRGHTAHEILAHVVAWRAWVLERLRGAKPAPPPDDGWAPIPRSTEADWHAILARAHESETALLTAVRRLDDAALDRHRDALRFLLHHDLHHGGQIGWLASASRDPASVESPA